MHLASPFHKVEVRGKEFLQIVSGLAGSGHLLAVCTTRRLIDFISVPGASVVNYGCLEARVPVLIRIGCLRTYVFIGIHEVLARTYPALTSAGPDWIVGNLKGTSCVASDQEYGFVVRSGVVLLEVCSVIPVCRHPVIRMYAVSSFTEAKASFEDGLAGLDYLICGFRCPLPFLQIPLAVVARARGIQQHTGLDGQS